MPGNDDGAWCLGDPVEADQHRERIAVAADSASQRSDVGCSAWFGEMEAERKRGERNARGAKMSGNASLEKEWNGYTNGIKVAMNARRRRSQASEPDTAHSFTLTMRACKDVPNFLARLRRAVALTARSKLHFKTASAPKSANVLISHAAEIERGQTRKII